MKRARPLLLLALVAFLLVGCSGGDDGAETGGSVTAQGEESISEDASDGKLRLRLAHLDLPPEVLLDVTLRRGSNPVFSQSWPRSIPVIEREIEQGQYRVDLSVHCGTCKEESRSVHLGWLAFESRPEMEIKAGITCRKQGEALACDEVVWGGNAVLLEPPISSSATPVPPSAPAAGPVAEGQLTVSLLKMQLPEGYRPLVAVQRRNGDRVVTVASHQLPSGGSLQVSMQKGQHIVNVSVFCATGCPSDASARLAPISFAQPAQVTVDIELLCLKVNYAPGISCSPSRVSSQTTLMAPASPVTPPAPEPPLPPPAPVPEPAPAPPAINGTAYRPAPWSGPILANTISPRVCSSWMSGSNLLSICDAEQLNKSWRDHTLNQEVPFKVTIGGRKVRVGSTPGLVQVLPDDSRGALQLPARITLEGKISAGSYLLVSGSYYRPRWIARGQALFGRIQGMEQGGKATINVRLDNGRVVFDFRTPGGKQKPLRWIHSEGPGWRASLPPLPDGYADTPEQTARTYLAAVNARDGKVICQLLRPAARRLFTGERMPCWLLLTGYIGYSGENAEADFHHLELTSVGQPYRRTTQGTAFTAVPLKLRVFIRVRATKQLREETVDDVVWVQRLGEHWRLAKPSAIAPGGGDPSAVPDP